MDLFPIRAREHFRSLLPDPHTARGREPESQTEPTPRKPKISGKRFECDWKSRPECLTTRETTVEPRAVVYCTSRIVEELEVIHSSSTVLHFER